MDVAGAPNDTAKSKRAKRKQAKPMPQLTPEQWQGLTLLRDVLQPFHAAQTQLEGAKYATAGLVPLWIDQLRKHLAEFIESDDSDLAAAASRLLEDLDARWHTWPRSTLMAAALDFRTKYMGFFRKSDRDAAWDHIATEACAIYTLINRTTIAAGAAPNNTDSTQADVPTTVFAGGYDHNPDADDSDLSSSAPEADSTAGARALRLRVDTELQLYRKEKQIGQDADPLAHWRTKMIEYPLIALVARKWLAVPASSAESERLFSSAGLTVDKKRTTLGTERVSTLVFLKTSWPFLQAKGVLY